MAEQREIKVILFSDVVDSSGRMFDDEAGTVALIERDLALFARHLQSCEGTLVKNTGDGILATFETTVAALAFLQAALLELSGQSGGSLQHRFGMHIGEIYLKGDDIIGQGVHLTARLQTISPANGVAFTAGTYANLDPHYRARATPLGALELKGLPDRQLCYALEQLAFLGDSSRSGSPALANRWRNLQRELRRTTPAQRLSAALVLLLALAGDLDPANPISTWLLDRRLAAQKQWRSLTGQRGPSRPALPVVLLQTDKPVLPRRTLVELLEGLPPERFPRVALDLVLDQQGDDPAATAALVTLLKQQQRQQLLAGYFGAESNGVGAGQRSMPLPVLLQAGLQPRDLIIGTEAGPGPLQPLPLQLLRPITPDNLAGAIATGGPSGGSGIMPSDAVIDWSLRWGQMLRVVTPQALRNGREPLLLVGRLHEASQPTPDLFQTPAAFYNPEPLWGGTAREMPGVLLQAVVAQSISLQHWLTPVSNLLCVLLAGLGGLALAGRRRRSPLLPLLALVLFTWTLLALQLAVSLRLLLPIVLPGLALGGATWLRRR